MTPVQTQQIIFFSMQGILDSSLTLNIRGQMLLCLHRAFVDMLKQVDEAITTSPSDILECLATFCKDIDSSLKTLLDGLLSIKADVGAKKGSRIKWMNDEDQKNAEIRDLLYSDYGLPFVNLSKERCFPADSYDPSRAQEEYLLY